MSFFQEFKLHEKLEAEVKELKRLNCITTDTTVTKIITNDRLYESDGQTEDPLDA